jgi:hypothetical protein
MRFRSGALALIAFFSLFLSTSAFAIVTIDGNVFYFSDSYVNSTTQSYSRLIWDAAVSLNLSKKGQVMLGWDYNSGSFDDTTGTNTTQTVAVTGMGPKLTFYLDKELEWSLAGVYDLILNATQSGTSSYTYRGYGLKAEFGYTGHISESMLLGIKMNWYEAVFTEQITNQRLVPVLS